MDYGHLVREAWSLTWHHRFLWLFGLLAGGAMTGGGSFGGTGGGSFGGPFGWSGDGAARRPFEGALGPQGEAMRQWLTAGGGWLWLSAAIAVMLLLGLVLFVISLIARGAVVSAAVELEAGHDSSLGSAWRSGQHLFWRYLRLTLVLVALAFVLAAIVGVVTVPTVMLLRLGGLRSLAWLAVVVAVPVVLLAIVAAVGASIVIVYAQRAIAVDDVGAIAALRFGWETLRRHLGESLLTWAISLGLSAVAVMALLATFVGAVAWLGGFGWGIWALLGVRALTIVYAIVGGLTVLAIGVVLAAIANTFFWNYWTLAYMELHRGSMHPPASA